MTISQDELMELVRIQLGAEKIRPEDRFQEDLDAESADVLNIVAATEDRWGVIIEEEELSEIASVADLIALVRGRAGSTS
jgi:acyl carrier protein